MTNRDRTLEVIATEEGHYADRLFRKGERFFVHPHTASWFVPVTPAPAAGDDNSLSTLSLPKLKEMVTARGIDLPEGKITKSILLELLAAQDKKEETDGDLT